MIGLTRYHMVTRVLVIAGIVAALPLAVGFLLIEHSAKTRLSDAAGTNFVWFAETAASAFDTAVARELELVRAVARSERTINALVDRTESTDLSDPLTASGALYRDIALLDRNGGLVASSSISGEPEPAWLRSTKVAIGKLERPRAVEAFVEIGDDPGTLVLVRPVRDGDASGASGVIGFVRAELDTERLFASISNVRIGGTGHACLFDRDSGRLLAGRRADCTDGGNDTFARLDELTRAEREGARYFMAGASGPASFDRGEGWIVGYTRPELSRSLPEVHWVVAVEQSLAEAHAPLASLSRDLLTYFLGMGVLVLVLAAFMSVKLERPLAEAIDLHTRPTTAESLREV